MKKKYQIHEKNPLSQRLGSQAIMLALTLGATGVQADEPKCVDDCNEGSEQASRIIELIEVYGVESAPYMARRSGDMRHGAELAATPQTISILTQSQIQDSGKSDLKEILASQAGVTLGTGENGNAFGDRYVIRGHEARSDVFVDGLRDPGMTTRESFATEQIEITKGPSATFAGRGSSGGAVNSITKQASPDYNFGIVDGSVGSDDHYRMTLDTNLALSANGAVRANFLTSGETAPDRPGIERDRNGALLSGYLSPTDQLRFIADAYYLKAEDVPDLGSYFDRTTRKPLKDIPVYAQDSDFLDTEVKAFTLRTEYDLSDQIRLTNATRWGETENGYVTTGMRGATRDASDPIAPGEFTMSLSTHQGWQEVEYAATQFNLFVDNELFGLSNKWVVGIEYTDETVQNGVFDIENLGDTNCVVPGRGGLSESYCILGAGGAEVANIDGLMQRQISRGDEDSHFDVQTVSAYVMDTVALSTDWQVFFGLRQDRFDYANTVNGRSGIESFDYSDTLINGHLGLVYQFRDNANVYLTYSTASNINGGESDVGGSCGYGGLCGDPDQVAASDPERVENIELGSKWKLFDEKLLFSAALFQITKSDVMESVGDAYSSLGTLNTGKNRVEGFEVSLSGAITDTLSIQMSAAVMESEVLDSIDEANEGLELSNFADDSLYVQLRYQPNDRFAIGAALTYKSEMYGGQPDTAAGYDPETGEYAVEVPDYTVVDLFANYYYSDALNFRLNVGNVFDKEYWTAAYRSGSFMYLGDARSVRASVTWSF